MELKKPHPSRLVRGVQIQMGLVPHPCVVDKNSGEKSQEQGGPAPHQHPSPNLGPTVFHCQEGKSPQLLAAKTSEDLVSGRNFWSPKLFVLKNPHTDSPTQTHSL